MTALPKVEDVSSAYKPPDSAVQITARVPQSTRRDLDEVVELWRLYAKERGDKVADIDFSYVVRRLLRLGCDQAFAEFGVKLDEPIDWEQVRKAVRQSVAASKR